MDDTKDTTEHERGFAARITAAAEFSTRLRREDPSTYVYTYPFKGAYRPLRDPEVVARAWAGTTGPVNVYVHFPYCEMKCSFCNLFTTTHHDESAFERYADAVVREARLVASVVHPEQIAVDSVYFGGGTPSLLAADALLSILTALRTLFPFRDDAEFAIEATPDAVDDVKLRALCSLGFRRISFGVQSFDPDELHAMGRPYDPGLSQRAVMNAMNAGFPNVNVDLIYGFPAQTDATWRNNLAVAVALGVPTITIYPLTLRAKTQFGRQHTTTPGVFDLGAPTYRRYDHARAFLLQRGYHQFSAAGFARPGGGSRHECNEFAGLPTIGVGAAALSYAPGAHYTSGDYLDVRTPTSIIAEYERAVAGDRLPICTGIVLGVEERQRRHVIMRLLHDGVSREAYRAAFSETLDRRFGSELAALAAESCTQDEGDRIALTERGRRFSSLVVDLFASETVKQLAGAYR